MGIDRLVMFLTDSSNIKEVLVRRSLLSHFASSAQNPDRLFNCAFPQLFPAMRPEEKQTVAPAVVPAGSSGTGGK
jgi:hypothetical protein